MPPRPAAITTFMQPRGMTRAEAAAYCGCESMASFSDWVRRGIVPGPLPRTHRWDRKAIDAALDRASGLETRLQRSHRWRDGERNVRVQLKGIHRVRWRLANGEIAIYYYAWRGGPRLIGQPGSPEFMRSYNEAVASRRLPVQGKLFTLIAEFRASSEYSSRSEATKRAYAAYLRMIEAEFGDMPIEALSDPEVRGEFKRWRDGMADTPRKADYAWTTLARVLSVAHDRGRIPVNPCQRGGRLYEADRTERVWTEDDIARLLAVASPNFAMAALLALWTGQDKAIYCVFRGRPMTEST